MLFAQQTANFTKPHTWLRKAAEHFDAKHYVQVSSILSLRNEAEINTLSNEEKQEYGYYKNATALALNKPFCEKNMKDFVLNSPFESYRKRGSFLLARYYFNQGDFEQAIPFYENADITLLDNIEISERNFELGYCYLVTQQLQKVDPLFASIKDVKTEYFTPGNYYYGVLSYYKKKYDEALSCFEKVKDKEPYNTVVPFYITELNYIKGNKEKALSDALLYLKNTKNMSYTNEMYALVGQIYFEKRQYEKAIQYLTWYESHAQAVRSEDKYKIAFANYQLGNIEEALTYFKAIESTSDYYTLACYYTGNCYLKSGNKEKAYQLFTENINILNTKNLKETVEFTIAKLSYELGNDDLAAQQLNYFSNTNKKSSLVNEANEMLTYLYIKNKQFDEAIKKLNTLTALDNTLKAVYQKANYARGIQMLLANNAEEATYNFEESNKYKVDEDISTMSYFWNAEANYRLGRYVNAQKYANTFLTTNKKLFNKNQFEKNAHLLNAYVYFHNNEKEKMVSEIKLSRDTATDIFNTANSWVLKDSIKPNYIPANVPSVICAPFIFAYQLPESEISLPYKPIPLKPLAITNKKIASNINSYIKLGYGNLTTPIIEVGSCVAKTKTTTALAHLNYCNQKDTSKTQHVSTLAMDFTVSKKLNEHILDAKIGMDKNSFTYYGYDRALYKFKEEKITQKLQYKYVKVGLTPLSSLQGKYSYNPTLLVANIQDDSSASETYIALDVPVSTSYKKIGIQVRSIVELSKLNTNNAANTFVSVQPMCTYTYQQYTLQAGLFPSISQKNTMLLYHLLAAKKFELYNSTVTIHAYSKINTNTYKKITDINPYVNNNYTLKHTKENAIRVGIDGSLLNGMDYVVKTGISMYNNMPFFVSDTNKEYRKFSILYENKMVAFVSELGLNYYINKQLWFGGTLHIQPIIAKGNIRQVNNNWHYQNYWMDIFATYTPSSKVSIKGILYAMPGVKVLEKKISYIAPIVKTNNAAIDFSVLTSFKLNNKLSAFIDVNNLFGSKYQRWYGYSTFGTNFQVGFVRNFASQK